MCLSPWSFIKVYSHNKKCYWIFTVFCRIFCVYIYIYIYIRAASTIWWWWSKSWLTVVEGDPNAPFLIATTPRLRGGCYSYPRIAPLTLDTYLILLSVKHGGIEYHFWVFGRIRSGIELRSTGPLAVCVCIHLYIYYVYMFIYARVRVCGWVNVLVFRHTINYSS